MLPYTDGCDFWGVSCTGNDVTEMNVIGRELQGLCTYIFAIRTKCSKHTVGTLPSAFGRLTGLTGLYMNRNLLNGTIPHEFGDLVSLKDIRLNDNHALTGTIPKELCSSRPPMYMDVTDTQIQCYSGCLSTLMIVSDFGLCTNDGEITARFLAILVPLLITSAVISAVFIAVRFVREPAVLKHMRHQMNACIGRLCCLSLSRQSCDEKTVAPAQNGVNLAVISLGKLILVIIASMTVSRLWESCSKPSGKIQETCATSRYMDGDNQCESFCNDYEDSGTCVAKLTYGCACSYWMVFQLSAILLHVVHYLLQLGCLYLFDDFDPQRRQYAMIVEGRVWANRRELLNPWFCMFPFLEVLTALYVWMELLFPPIRCGTYALSLFYYPIVMTVLEFGKINAFAGSRYFGQGRYMEAVLSLFRADIVIVYFMLSFAQAVVYFFSGLVVVPFVRSRKAWLDEWTAGRSPKYAVVDSHEEPLLTSSSAEISLSPADNATSTMT